MKIKNFSQNLKKTGPGSKMTLAMSLAIIACVGLYNWCLSPQTNYLQAAQQYTRIAENAERQVSILEKSIARKENELVNAQTQIARTKSRLFTRDESIAFLSNIQPLAKKLGCVIDELDFDLGEGFVNEGRNLPVNVIKKSVNISITGQYNSISQFVNSLCDHQQEVVVGNMEIRVTPDFSALNSNMSITIYIIEDKEIDSNVEL